MPTSVRLDAETQALVARLARKTGQSKSAVIRAAITQFAEHEASRGSDQTPYDTMKHLIGIARGGPSDLSVRTGEKVRSLMLARRRR